MLNEAIIQITDRICEKINPDRAIEDASRKIGEALVSLKRLGFSNNEILNILKSTLDKHF